MKPRALILRAAGVNGDAEMELAFRWAGAVTERVHIRALLAGKPRLQEYDIFVLPGGFSYGDHISAGRVLANEVARLPGLKAFISAGKPVLGVCNGFQALVKSGILPGELGDEQSVSLVTNDSARFECAWVRVEVTADSFFTKGLPKVVDLPMAHGEGKLVADSAVLKKVSKQVVFRYVDNPSGSEAGIAGLLNRKGNVLGMMPHPERFLTAMHHPVRTHVPDKELGLQIIRNCVHHAKG